MPYDSLKIEHIKKIENDKVIYRTIFKYKENGIDKQKNIECESPLYQDFFNRIYKTN